MKLCLQPGVIPNMPEFVFLGERMTEYIKRPGQLLCLPHFKRYKFSAVKIQCVGPATLVMSGYGEDDAVQRICQHVEGVLRCLSAGEIILFLDEPSLGLAGFDYQSMWEAIFYSFKVTRGVHCCDNMDWDVLFKSPGIDIVSIDATLFDITKFQYYRNGKRIAWGVRTIEDVKDFQKGDLITPPCGFSPQFYSVADCRRIMAELKEIAKKITK